MWDRAIILRIVGASLWGLCLLSPARANVLDVSFGTVAEASPGSYMHVPVNLAIKDGNFVSSFNLVIQYDAARLSLAADGVNYVNPPTGIVPVDWNDDFSVNVTTPPIVRVGYGVGSGSFMIDTGTILDLKFQVLPNAPIGNAILSFDSSTEFVDGNFEPYESGQVSFHDGGISVVPEPSSLLLMGVMVGCGLPFLPLRRRRVAKAD